MDTIEFLPRAMSHFLILAEGDPTPTPLPTATPASGFHEYAQIALHHPFTWGLVVGLVLVFLTWLSGLAKSREARREVRRLREHLNTQMDITSRGNTAMRSEIDTLKQQNENLRVAVKEWQTKPGRNEMRMLAVYDRAIRILNQNAPGFSPVWERAVKESEEELVSSESGMSSMLRRAFRPFAALGNGTPGEGRQARAFLRGDNAQREFFAGVTVPGGVSATGRASSMPSWPVSVVSGFFGVRRLRALRSASVSPIKLNEAPSARMSASVSP